MIHNYYKWQQTCIYTINTTNNHYKAWQYSSLLSSSTIVEPEFLHNSGEEPNIPPYSDYVKLPLDLKSFYIHFMNFPLHLNIIRLSNINANHSAKTL